MQYFVAELSSDGLKEGHLLFMCGLAERSWTFHLTARWAFNACRVRARHCPLKNACRVVVVGTTNKSIGSK